MFSFAPSETLLATVTNFPIAVAGGHLLYYFNAAPSEYLLVQCCVASVPLQVSVTQTK